MPAGFDGVGIACRSKDRNRDLEIATTQAETQALHVAENVSRCSRDFEIAVPFLNSCACA